MKTLTIYNSIEKDDCFRIAIANVLQLPPSKIPHFAKKYGVNFVKEARKWLNKRGKTITFCHIKGFLEGGNIPYNYGLFPQGLCILSMSGHVEIVYDGKIIMTDTESGENWYDEFHGYFIIHDYVKYRVK